MASVNCIQVRALARVAAAATVVSIQAAEAAIGLSFPPLYRSMLLCADGFMYDGESYSLSMYGSNELAERNTTCEVQDYLPTLLMIGDDGGGRGIFIEHGQTDGAVYLCDMGAFFLDDLELIASDLQSWISNGFDLGDPPVADEPKTIDVYLVRPPQGGLQGLRRILQTLDIPVRIAELRNIIEHIPCCVLHEVPYHLYSWRCAAINDGDPCLEVYDIKRPGQALRLSARH